MAEVRIPVANTVGKTVRINPNATIGATIGTDLKLPDGTIPSLAELATALASEAVAAEQIRSFQQLIDQIADSQVPVSAVTQHEAALTILETQITDGVLLARVAANETISGVWTYTADDGFIITNASPEIHLRETDATADEGNWIIRATGDILKIQTASDAAPTTGAESFVTFLRTGTVADEVRIKAALLNVQGALTATTYGGITEANLVDKSDGEIIAGDWEHTGLLIIAAGTEGAPSLHFTGDPDTGIYSPAANAFAVTVGGTEAVRYTGASAPLIRYGMTTGITASTTQTQGQQPLPGSYNEISVCANNNDVVTLPNTASGEMCIVINNGAKRLQVFPASGQDLGLGVNQSDLVKAGASVFFVSTSASAWFDIASKFANLLDTDTVGITANDFLYYTGSTYKHTGGLLTWDATLFDITGDLQVSGKSGFYGKTAIAQQTGVAVSSAGIHAALVNLGLITA